MKKGVPGGKILLSPLFDEPFYVDVLRYRTLRDQDPYMYLLLREYLGEEKKKQFRDEIDWDEKFLAEVLTADPEKMRRHNLES